MLQNYGNSKVVCTSLEIIVVFFEKKKNLRRYEMTVIGKRIGKIFMEFYSSLACFSILYLKLVDQDVSLSIFPFQHSIYNTEYLLHSRIFHGRLKSKGYLYLTWKGEIHFTN